MQCTFPGCEQPAKFHFSRIQNRKCAEEKHWCELHAREQLTRTSFLTNCLPFTGKRSSFENAKQFEISSLIISEVNDQQVVYLHEVDGKRTFPLLIGIFEAASIDRRLKGYGSPRPLTHDAWADSIQLLGGKVQDVLVERLENRIYYTIARIEHQGRLLQFDIRPSDGLILALLTDCPIFVAESVLDKIDAQGEIK